MKEDRDFVTALARGIQVLQCFTAEHPELGTTQIAAKVKLPQSTVWRLCYTLQQVGLLVPGREADKLRAGPGVLTLQHRDELVAVDCPSSRQAELAKCPRVAVPGRWLVAVGVLG